MMTMMMLLEIRTNRNDKNRTNIPCSLATGLGLGLGLHGTIVGGIGRRGGNRRDDRKSQFKAMARNETVEKEKEK